MADVLAALLTAKSRPYGQGKKVLLVLGMALELRSEAMPGQENSLCAVVRPETGARTSASRRSRDPFSGRIRPRDGRQQARPLFEPQPAVCPVSVA